MRNGNLFSMFWAQIQQSEGGDAAILKVSPPYDVTTNLVITYSESITIDWGDGTIDRKNGAATQATLSHHYASAGDYTIRIEPYAALSNLKYGSILLCAVEKLPAVTNDALQASAFSSAVNLRSIPLPDDLKSIGNQAFSECRNLLLESLPDSITSIGQQGFYNNSILRLSNLPASLVSVGVQAFQGCGNCLFTSLPNGLTTIGNQAFQSCSKMRIDTIPASLKTVGTHTTRYVAWPERLRFLGKPTSISASMASDAPSYAYPYDIYVPWSSGAVANAPWGFAASQVWYDCDTTSWEAIEAKWKNPVMYYPMDEILSTLPTAQTATLNGTGCEAVAYKGIDCLKFTGATYFSIPNAGVKKKTQGGRRFAISLWVATQGTRVTYKECVMMKYGQSATFDNGAGFGLTLQTSGHPVNVIFRVHDTATSATPYTVASPDDNGWHHLVANCFCMNGWTWTAWTAEIYLDGEYKTTLNRTVNNNGLNETFLIGRNNANQPNVAMHYAGVRMYNRFLTAEDVATLHQEFSPED